MLELSAAFHLAVQNIDVQGTLTDGQESNDIIRLSHGVAIVLLFSELFYYFLACRNVEHVLLVYASYLIFELWSHASLYADRHGSNNDSSLRDAAMAQAGNIRSRSHLPRNHTSKDAVQMANAKAPERTENLPASKAIGPAQSTAIENTEGHGNGPVNGDTHPNKLSTGVKADPTTVRVDAAETEKGKIEEEEAKIPSMSLVMCIALLVVVTIVSFSFCLILASCLIAFLGMRGNRGLPCR